MQIFDLFIIIKMTTIWSSYLFSLTCFGITITPKKDFFYFVFQNSFAAVQRSTAAQGSQNKIMRICILWDQNIFCYVRILATAENNTRFSSILKNGSFSSSENDNKSNELSIELSNGFLFVVQRLMVLRKMNRFIIPQIDRH